MNWRIHSRDRARRDLQAVVGRDLVESAPERGAELASRRSGSRSSAGRISRSSSGGQVGIVARRRRDLGLADLAHRLEVGARGEQRRRGHELPRDDAHREHVGDRADRHAERGLGRHVAELALDLSALGVELPARRLRDAEVDHLEVTGVRDDHVRRRDVAVDDVEPRAVLVDARCARSRARRTARRGSTARPPAGSARSRGSRSAAACADRSPRPAPSRCSTCRRCGRSRRPARCSGERAATTTFASRMNDSTNDAILGEMREHPLERDRALEARRPALLRAMDRAPSRRCRGARRPRTARTGRASRAPATASRSQGY